MGAGLPADAAGWLMLVTGMAVALASGRAWMTADARRLRQRLAEVAGRGEVDAEVGIASLGSLARPRRRNPRWERTAQRLERAGIPLKAREYALLRLAGTVVAIALGFALGRQFGALIALAASIAVPAWLLPRRIEARMRSIEGQWADSLVLMASALHAGHSLPQAVLASAHESADPLGGYLLEMHRLSGVGVPLEQALEAMAVRLGQPDMALVAHAVAVERQVGGSLAEILDGIAAVVRDRIQLRQRLRAATAQNRLSAMILTLLPVGVGLILVATAGPFVSILWTSTTGLAVLGAIAVLDALGTMWIRRVSRIDV